jgi:hypothetical protein
MCIHIYQAYIKKVLDAELVKISVPVMYTTEGSSVIRVICSEGSQLRRFNMVTQFKNWSHFKVRNKMLLLAGKISAGDINRQLVEV